MAEFNAKQGVNTPYIVLDNTIGANGGCIKFTASSEETVIMSKKDTTVSFKTSEVPSHVATLPLAITEIGNMRSLCYSTGALVVAGTSYLGYSSNLKSITRINSSPFNAGSFQPNRVSNPTSTLWVVGANGSVHTSDNGTTWTSRTVDTSRGYYECVFFRGRMWITTTGGVIRSDNYGSTWNNVQIPAEPTKVFTCAFADANLIAIGANDSTVYTSTDGSSWVKRNFPEVHSDVRKIAYHKGEYHIQTASGEIYTTTDFNTFKLIRSFNTNSTSMVTTNVALCVATDQPMQVAVTRGNAFWDYIPISASSSYVNATAPLDDENILILTADYKVIQVTLGKTANTLLEMTEQGVTISAPQSTKANSLARKDYVDFKAKEVMNSQKTSYESLVIGGYTGTETQLKDSLNEIKDVNLNAYITKAEGGEVLKHLTYKGTVFTYDDQLVNKGYVVQQFPTKADLQNATNNYLPLSGGTLTGDLIINKDVANISFSKADAVLMNIRQTGDAANPTISVQTSETPTSSTQLSTFARAMQWMTSVDGTLYSWGKANNGFARQSTNNGVTWDPIPGLSLASNAAMLRLTKANDTLWFSGFDGQLYKSAVGSNVWAKINIPEPTMAVLGVREYNSALVLAGGLGVFRSINGGTTWTRVYKGITGTLYDFIDMGGTVISFGHLLTAKSTDGITWTQIPFFSDKHIVCGVRDGNMCYLYDDVTHKVYVNRDPSLTLWDVVLTYPGDTLTTDALYFGGVYHFGTDKGGKIITTTDFMEWKTYIVPGVTNCRGLAMSPDDSIVYVDTSGLVMSVRLGILAQIPLMADSRGVYTRIKQSVDPRSLTRKDYVDSVVLDAKNSGYNKTEADARYLKLSGGEITGNLSIKGKLTINNAPLGYFTDTGDMNTNTQNGYSFIKLAKNGPTAHGVDKSYGAAYVFGDESVGGEKSVNQIYLSQTTPQRMFIRGNIGGTWKNWVKVYHSEDKPTLAELKAAPSGFGLGEAQGPRMVDDDCNKTAVSGFYNVYENTLNTPSTTGPSGSMLLDLHWGPGTGGEAQHQLFFNYQKDELAFRRQYAGDWKPWVKVYTEANKPTPAAIGAATPEDIAAAGVSISSVYWAPSRSTMGVGGVPGDGQLLDRATYPALFKLVQDNKVPRCTETEWTTDPTKRGCYTLGDGATTFRVPDYNGKVTGSKSTFQRGDGLNSSTGGVIQGDAIRNITGEVSQIAHKSGIHYGINWQDATSTGAFSPRRGSAALNLDSLAGTIDTNAISGFTFNANDQVPTASENRPVNVAGVWVIKAAYKVENTSAIDAQQLSSKVAEIDSKLQNVYGSGTPVLATHWVQLRSAMWEGFTAADGQTLSREAYPDAWAAIKAGLVPVTTEAIWASDPRWRGAFTEGDGETTFRIPDYNGKTTGSLGAAFLRGDGLNSSGFDGAIQEHKVQSHNHGIANDGALLLDSMHSDGSMSYVPMFATTGDTHAPTWSWISRQNNAKTKVSIAMSGQDETVPVNVTGCWAIKLFSAQMNQGSVNISALQDRITQLETKASSKWQPMSKLPNLVIPAGLLLNDSECYFKQYEDRLVIKGIMRRSTGAEGMGFTFKNTTGSTVFAQYTVGNIQNPPAGGTSAADEAFVICYSELIRAANNGTVVVSARPSIKDIHTTAVWWMFDIEMVFV